MSSRGEAIHTRAAVNAAAAAAVAAAGGVRDGHHDTAGAGARGGLAVATDMSESEQIVGAIETESPKVTKSCILVEVGDEGKCPLLSLQIDQI